MARPTTKIPRTTTTRTHQLKPRGRPKANQPRQPRQRQSSSCPICLQRTAAKKMIAVLPTQADSLLACKDCAKELRRDLLKDAYAAAMTPLPEAQECAANLEILLGVRLGAIPVRHREGGRATAESQEGFDIKDERDFLVEAPRVFADEEGNTFTGATPTDIQRLATQLPTDVTSLKEPAGAPRMNPTASDYFSAGPKNDG